MIASAIAVTPSTKTKAPSTISSAESVIPGAATAMMLNGPMPTEIRVIRASEFLRATAEGAYDLEASRQILLGLASAVPSPEDINVPIDFREVSSQLTLPSLYQLAREFTELRIAANRRTALLVPPDRFDDAEFFAISAGSMGRRVRAFTSFEEAFDWLVAHAPSP